MTITISEGDNMYRIKLESPGLVAQALEAHAMRLRAKSRTRRYAGDACAPIRISLREKAQRLDAEARSIKEQLKAAHDG
jgi:anti-sigma factor RsiW